MQSMFKLRLKQALKALNNSSSALLLSSSPVICKSRDADFPFYQNRDFYYLTGIEIADIVLLCSGKNNKAYLFAKPEDPAIVIWDGARPNLKKIATQIGCELIITTDVKSEVKAKLRHHEELFFDNQNGSMAWALAQEIFGIPSHLNANANSFPRLFKHSSLLMDNLRLFKDKYEIDLIKQAVDISYRALNEIKPLISAGTREHDLAAALVYMLKLMDAEEAFHTIAASGKAAATLHYKNLKGTLKRNELFLLDFGATYHGYSSDITRVFPVRGFFENWEAELYDIVFSANRAAIKKVKAGTLVKQVYDAAAKELTIGLKELGVLKGNITSLLEKGAYKKYFPHGIGHTLGLDVHDVGNFRGNNAARLEAGMVFTIEPGLYFAKKTGKLPACGIRLEEDILVTKSGSINLTDKIPMERKAVEGFLMES